MRSTMNFPNTRFWAVAVALAAVALSGCVGGAQATSSIYVKDALTDDASEVYVTFTKAQVKLDGGGWTTVYEGKKTIELLSLNDADAREELAAFDLAQGSYEGLRIAVSEVTVVDHDGQETLLNVYGNIVSIADDFTVSEDGVDILVDFDLEAGVDLEAGTYTPFVKAVQTSDDDADGDGRDDVRDVDDDDDGVEDHEDDDRDGDGEDDEPRQVHADLANLCAAERDEELAEMQADRNESLTDARHERDEALLEAEQERDEELAEARDSEERAEAWAQYNETVAEVRAEYDEETAEVETEHGEEVAEVHAEYDECLRDEDDDHDGDDHSGTGHNGTDEADDRHDDADHDEEHSGSDGNGTDEADQTDHNAQDQDSNGSEEESGRDGSEADSESGSEDDEDQ